MRIKVGTRGSKLALRQTEEVLKMMGDLDPGLTFEVVVIRTTGDRVQDSPLSKIGSKGLFVKEIEEALLRGEIDMAVHSMKDLPTTLPPGLTIGAIPKRLDPRDVLISRDGSPLEDLPEGCLIGTSSLRRRVQIKGILPGCEVIPLRGNLDTRIRKLKEGRCDAIVVALSGLLRLEIKDVKFQVLPEDLMIPAPGQGALAVECRSDWPLRDVLCGLNDPKSSREVLCERAFLEEMGGGCQVPLGALAREEGGQIVLRAMVAEVEGGRILRGEERGTDPVVLGRALARRLKEEGAEEILKEVYGDAERGLLPPL